jgi:hypothetical protein
MSSQIKENKTYLNDVQRQRSRLQKFIGEWNVTKVCQALTCLFLHSPALDATASGLYSLAISTGSIHFIGDIIPNHLHHTPRSAGWTGTPETRDRQVTSRPDKMAAICFHFNR